MKNENKMKLSAKEKRMAKKERLSSMSQKQRKKYYLKRACLTVVIAFVVLATVLVLTKLLSDKVAPQENFIEQVQEIYPTYTPFPAEWDVDLSKDEDYLCLNTSIRYGVGDSGSLYSLEDFYGGNMHEGQKFFAEYFRILKEGDYEKYPSLFSDSYKRVPAEKRFEKNVERVFPPQRVHDILVREIGRAENAEKNVIYGIYFVDYKIDRNSNLFRNDIGRNSDLGNDTSRPLYFQLVTCNPNTENAVTYINNMYTESSIKAHAAASSSVEE